MPNLSDWLVENGFSQYVDAFDDNDITFDVLTELDQSDLKELGLSLGHQKKFLKVVRSLSENTPAPTNTGESGSVAERRQLTVMFCDLVDSTHLVNRIGAEQMRDLIHEYQAVCKKAINRYNGYIQAFQGDGVVVFFGYPQAHERDADRCIRAGLLLLELIQPLNEKYQQMLGVTVELRIGIATGPVVVGDQIGDGAFLQTSVIGETPNLAARIQSLGRPDSITVADLTHKLVSSAFTFEDRGQHKVKGLPEPVQVWEIAENATQDNLALINSLNSLQMIGRAEELQLVHARWKSAKQGDGQFVSVSGEAGIGKSKLIEVFLRGSECCTANQIKLNCSPYYTGSVLYPVLEQMERASKLQHGCEASDRVDYIKEFFDPSIEWHEEAIQYFRSLISLDSASPLPTEDVSIQTQQQRAFDAWIEVLVKRFNDEPMIMLIEDAHWLDATTIELINRLIGRLHHCQCLLIVSARPEFVPPWKGYQCMATDLRLSRLDRKHTLEVIERVTPDTSLPPSVIDLIVSKTDGVPLFIEELTKSMVEQQEKDGVLMGHSGQVLPNMEVPESLNDLLMSRLDKEPSVKHVAQMGAAIGREFAYQLLASIAPQNEDELRMLLERVVNTDLVFESGLLPTPIYTFRHALVQDAAYQSLLHKNRRILHEKIALSLETQLGEGGSAELIAHHWTEAQRPEKAVLYWHRAARDATRLWANAEAVKRYRAALKMYAAIPEPERSLELKLDLLLELGASLRAVSGSSAAETVAVFNQATRVCDDVDNIDYVVRSYYGAFATSFTAAKLAIARSAGETLLDRSTEHNHVAGIAAGHQALGMYAFATGDLAGAKNNLELALSFKDRYSFEFDIQYPVLSQSYLSWALYLLGHEEHAIELSEASIVESESTSAYNHALVMANACYLRQFQGNTESLAALTRQLKILCTEKGLPVWYAVAEFFDCWQKCQHNPDDENLDTLVEALGFWAEDEIETPYFKAIVAQTLVANERHSAGETLAEQARVLARETGELWYEKHLVARSSAQVVSV